MIARVLEEKGIYEYFKAAEKIKLRYPEVKINLIGWFDKGPSAIKKESLDFFFENKIINFLGFKNDVRTYIKNSSVYVLPSYREGVPRTVLEALSIGRAIITTNAPGCKETVIDGLNGFLVPIKDSKALEHSMTKFIEKPALIKEMGKESHKVAKERFDVKKINRVFLTQMQL